MTDTPAPSTQADGASVTDAATSPVASPAASPAAVRPPNRIIASWRREQEFATSKPGGPVAIVDGHGITGMGPVDTLLSALATCASADVVEILKKRRTPVTSLEVEVVGRRVDATPRRLEHVLLRFRIAGAGIERDQAERAIELSITKYCSVRDSLDPAIPVEWELDLQSS
ncbi:MAG: OsmC family protein [Gemmatimonadota bacterium]|nr:OsmC family protein [Gemmatimonadota bacterium]